MSSRTRKWLKASSVMVVFVGAFVAYDLYYPRTTHLLEFDADDLKDRH